MEFMFDDGGRAVAGFKGFTGDCVTRSIAIVSGKSYQEVYDSLFSLGKKTPRNGVKRRIYQRYLETLGFKWVPTMKIGQGCKVHLVKEELPTGKLVVRLSKHLTAVIDGIIHDTHDPQRNTPRCVYGYFIKP